MVAGAIPAERRERELARKVAFLTRPESYPERPREVRALETHMSWLFLTERHVYKLKKPVRYPFLDFSTVARRRDDCIAEVRLNRRLAPDVYLGVLALVAQPSGALRLGGDGPPVDWLVRMRRLPQDRMLDHLIATGRARETEIRALARLLTEFYLRAAPVRMSGKAYRESLSRDLAASRRELRRAVFGLPRCRIDAVAATLARGFRRHARLFDARIAAGRVVEGHGDLRPEHVCLLPEPRIIDCLEFNHAFRLLDAADELGFLALECERLGAPWVGRVLFESYAAISGDRPPPPLVQFYQGHRAMLRAKLSIWHLRDHVPDPAVWRRKAIDYLDLAERHAARLDRA